MMKKLLLSFGLCLLLTGISLKAGNGDTTVVRSHNGVRMNWYGNYDRPAQFPAVGTSYRKVLMMLTLGCGGVGCSGWDYTNQIFLRVPTGVWDSTITLVPDFTVDAAARDSICYQTDTTWMTFYDTLSHTTDSLRSGSLFIRLFEDPNNFYRSTDSFYVWPAGYWNYYFNGSGQRIDSVWVMPDTCRYRTNDTIWNPYEVHDNYELGRVITPYGGLMGANAAFTWTYDITDFSTLLHDSVGVRSFYSGWSDGFNITLDFVFIEGTPPRTPKEVRRVYNGNWNYGIATDPIDNHLPPRTFLLDTASKQAKFRITTTGHGFGGTQNCAEFCRKQHTVVIGNQNFIQDLWRDDCELNDFFPQSGTWIYDRAGWCPGSDVHAYDFEAGNNYMPGNPLTVDYTMQAFSWSGQPNQTPVYTVESYLFGYGNINRNLDAEILRIRKPTEDDMFTRINPICDEPEVVIRNNGSTTLTSVNIHYGVEGGPMSSYNWSGSLDFLDTAVVTLPTPAWGTLAASNNRFVVYLTQPNGGVDQDVTSDTAVTTFSAPVSLPSEIFLFWKTNANASQTVWTLYNDQGNALYQNSVFIGPNSIYRDTFHLPQGCYRLKLTDLAGDGLYFFNFSNQGQGWAKINDARDGTNILTLEANFGGSLEFNFTTYDVVANDPAHLTNAPIEVFPNPVSDRMFVSLNTEKPEATEISISSMSGNLVHHASIPSASGIVEVPLDGLPAGIYMAVIRSGSRTHTAKVVVIKN